MPHASKKRSHAIHCFLQQEDWLDGCNVREQDIVFLAAGEYNENHLLSCAGPPARQAVFRINHGSQLGLDRQIEYEFDVLTALRGSGVTPRPLHVHGAPDPELDLGKGVMLMEYLPGHSLDYERDLAAAARVFAAVHSQPLVDAAQRLLVQADPIRDIARESLGLLHRYPDHPRQKERDFLLEYHRRLLDLAQEHQGIFADEAMCIVNTEVNSGNFIVQEDRAWLVDWEKAVVSCRYQDLGHFLVPTTTRWKTSFSFTPALRLEFLAAYRKACGLDMALEEISFRTELMERTILLRALSWCFMAWYEYTRPGRTLTNSHTFSVITSYLDEMEWIVA